MNEKESAYDTGGIVFTNNDNENIKLIDEHISKKYGISVDSNFKSHYEANSGASAERKYRINHRPMLTVMPPQTMMATIQIPQVNYESVTKCIKCIDSSYNATMASLFLSTTDYIKLASRDDVQDVESMFIDHIDAIINNQ